MEGGKKTWQSSEPVWEPDWLGSNPNCPTTKRCAVRKLFQSSASSFPLFTVGSVPSPQSLVEVFHRLSRANPQSDEPVATPPQMLGLLRAIISILLTLVGL